MKYTLGPICVAVVKATLEFARAIWILFAEEGIVNVSIIGLRGRIPFVPRRVPPDDIA